MLHDKHDQEIRIIDHTPPIQAAADAVDWNRALELSFELGRLFEDLNHAIQESVRRTYDDFDARDDVELLLWNLEALRRIADWRTFPSDLAELKAFFVDHDDDEPDDAPVAAVPRAVQWCARTQRYLNLATGEHWSQPSPVATLTNDDDDDGPEPACVAAR